MPIYLRVERFQNPGVLFTRTAQAYYCWNNRGKVSLSPTTLLYAFNLSILSIHNNATWVQLGCFFSPVGEMQTGQCILQAKGQSSQNRVLGVFFMVALHFNIWVIFYKFIYICPVPSEHTMKRTSMARFDFLLKIKLLILHV